MIEITNSLESCLIKLTDELLNMRNMILDIEKRFIEYAETNPKGDDQWTEERLRAAEAKILELEKKINDFLSAGGKTWAY